MNGTLFSMNGKSGLPKGVSEFQDRHGKWRLRYRARGQKTYYFKGRPGTALFREELEACRSDKKISPDKKASARTPAGSIGALIALYYTTPEFTGLAPSSRKTYRSTLERFRLEHGTKSVANVERRHIKAILGAMSDRPSAANKLLDKLKILFRLALNEGWRRDDPTQGIRRYRTKSDGFHTWTEDEIALYEEQHPLGTTARLAFDLMLYTGQRRSDAVLIGIQHFSNGRVRVKQQKTGAIVSIFVHERLQTSIDACPTGDMTLLLTSYGQPFTANGFGNRMRKWCDEAGLPQCSSHGLRKATARRLAEAGCSNAQIKAITGHTTDSEVSRYTAAVNKQGLADQAMERYKEPKSG